MFLKLSITALMITWRLWSLNLQVPWNYAYAKGIILYFGYWIANFVITCHFEIFHFLSWKMKLTTTKNKKLAHVTLKNRPWKF